MPEPMYRDYLGTLKVNAQVAVMRLERALAEPDTLEGLAAHLPVQDIIDFEANIKTLNARL